MIILLNVVLLLFVIVLLVLAYILIYMFAGEDEKFNVEQRQKINYLVTTEDYDRGFSDKNEALDFAALHAGIVIDVDNNETIADFTTIDYNIIHDPHVKLTVNKKGVVTNVNK